jgi:hypothetical protein
MMVLSCEKTDPTKILVVKHRQEECAFGLSGTMQKRCLYRLLHASICTAGSANHLGEIAFTRRSNAQNERRLKQPTHLE